MKKKINCALLLILGLCLTACITKKKLPKEACVNAAICNQPQALFSNGQYPLHHRSQRRFVHRSTNQ